MADPEKAYLETETGTQIPCLFNPEQLSMSRNNSWAADTMPGRGVQTVRYQGASSGSLNLSLFFDTTDTGTDVSTYTGKIVQLMDVDTSLPGADQASNNVRPPWVKFHWGDLHSFKAVITSLSLSYTYFSSSGVPLRATMQLGLMQYEESDAFGPQNPTSGTPNPHRVHRVQPGETLDRISAKHYGDATKWRAIAEANGIQDPLALRPGTLLAVPRLDR